MSIIDELYYGNINISERDVKEGSDEQIALAASAEAQTKLMHVLPDNLKPMLTICSYLSSQNQECYYGVRGTF